MTQFNRNEEEVSILSQTFFNIKSEDDKDLDFCYSPERQQYPLNINPQTFIKQVEAFYEPQNRNIDKEDETIKDMIQIMNGSNESNEEDLNFKNDNPLHGLIIPTLPKIDDKEKIQKEKQNEKENNNSDIALKKTIFTSKVGNNPILIPFQTKKPQKRIDYAIKYFKTHFSNFLKEYGNKLIKGSLLPKALKNLKLFLPNHLSFTGNPTEQDNYKFLFFTVEDIFCYYKNEDCKVSRQKKNKTTIEKILQFIEGNDNDGKYEHVKSFFKMRLEDAYMLFYHMPEYFQKYATDSKTINLDKEFQAEKGFSLLDTNGFIKFCKMLRKKD